MTARETEVTIAQLGFKEKLHYLDFLSIITSPLLVPEL